jgi:Flp pilus assembly protein TadG
MALSLKAPAQFTADERGVVAPTFGLAMAVLFLCIGVAIDTNRAIHAQSTLGAAADAAALAGGKAMLDGRATDAEVRAATLKFFEENAKNGKQFANVPAPTITIDRKSGFVKVDVNGTVNTTVGRIAGVSTMKAPATATVESDQKDIELGLALDVTGSMSGSKIASLKTAAKDLVDILISDSGQANKVRIGLAPYSASVNAGQYAATTTAGLSTNGCVHERGGSEAFTDAAPNGPVDALGFRIGLQCPPQAVLEPLTGNKAVLKTSIGNYQAFGSTAGHIGAAWASYLISPQWNNIWPGASKPVAYGDKKTIKAMVLMTDGEFNTQYVNANGNSDAQARNICSEAKKRNVIVYSIGFQSPAQAEALLRNCATSADHYYSAKDGGELREAFVEIAKQLNNLRLTK